MTSVNVTTNKNTITVQEGDATTVTVATQGPQGASGSAAIADDSVVEAKLDIHNDPSGSNKFLGYTSNGMEWAVPPDTNTTYSVGDNGLTKNNFTDALKTKLDSVESNSTADQTGAEIKTAYEAESDTNAYTDAEKTKLSGIAASANNYSISSDLLDEDNMSTNSATKVPSQQSVKAYVDANATVNSTTVNSAGAVMNSDLDGKGELLVGDGSGDPTALAVGTNNYVLTADSGEATGLKWAAAGSGGDANQNAFSNFAVSGQDTVAADSTTDTVTLIGGTNVTITTNATNDEITFTSTDTNTTYSVGDNGLTKNNFTDALKTKLDGIATGAEQNVQSDWDASSGDAQILNKPTIPTNTNTTYSISCVDGDNTDEEKIRLTAGGDGSGTDDVVLEAGTGLSIARSGDKITFTNTVTDTNTQLTTEEVQDIIGAMVAGNTETNISVTYDDTNGKLDFVSTDTNTTYSVVTSSANGLAPQLPGSHGGKFLKADGTWEVPPDTNTTYSVQDGQLSQNNFTDTLKTKLDGIAANATANAGTVTSVTGTSPIASSGGTTPAISISAATTSAAGSMSSADKTKLDGIEASSDVTDATNVAAAGAVMDGDFSSNGLMKRTGAGTYTVDANSYITLTSSSSASSANGMRKITTSTSPASGGNDGDIWIKYTA